MLLETTGRPYSFPRPEEEENEHDHADDGRHDGDDVPGCDH
jgi:hypothetical protein